MVELTVCKSCSARIVPGHSFCPRCGAALNAPASTSQPATTEPTAVHDLPLAMARDAAARAAAAAREAAAQAASVSAASASVAGDDEVEDDADRRVELTPRSVTEEAARTEDRFLTPSVTNRTLGSIGAGRPSEAVTGPIDPAPGPAPLPSPAAAARPMEAAAPGFGVLAGRSGPLPDDALPTASPVAPTTASERIRATLASMAAEPKAELVATGLTALGGAFALISFFLPWTADNGLGIGTIDLHPRPGAWAFDTATGWPLFLMAAILLAAILASDKLEELMPGLAPTIRRLTEVAMPLLLGGILLGAGLMYQTLPWGCGGGIALLILGAALLIAGSIVGLFFPAGSRKD